MHSIILVEILLFLGLVISLFIIAADIVQQQKRQSPYNLATCQHFVGTWQYLDPKRQQLFEFCLTNSQELILNGVPLEVTIVLISPSLFIFKDAYGFTLKIHYHSPEECYLYDEANERYYPLKKLTH